MTTVAPMRLLPLLLLVACVFGAWRWWDGREAARADSADSGAAISENGFVSVRMPDGASRHAVLVLAPKNCPSDQARRSEALVAFLEDKGVPVVRGSSIAFSMDDPTPEQVAGANRAIEIFKRGAPAVFINGMAMSDPTPAQAAAEYRRLRATGR
ncbi:hypothetical protein [Luteimonas sp. MC1572]|uniref:hypothetical protein n=1 Tax=Luteimonas sp. MC1572 TaxID=2799325 RepID=UPI0018F09104|nr:hypothetical protein [Luteimonas sp. MC1572]MBJ6981032.1 hypothetical protein [Luteimonas sp. MC1572]QQO02375.1 hypothetical protein JGR64_09180 [Luteimonas sp. MC1572]